MKLKLIFFASLIVMLTSCGPYQEIKVTQIQNARILKMDKDGIDAEIDVKINNPNKIGFTVFRSNLDVLMNDKAIGTAHLKKRVKIKANAEETYTFVLSSKFDKLLSVGGIMGLVSIATSKSANITLKGDIKAGKLFYRKAFAVNSSQKVPLFK